MDTRTYKVPNIGCDGCVKTITSELSAQPGVQSVQGDVASKTVTIAWNAPATADIIEAKLTEIDYPPEKTLMA